MEVLIFPDKGVKQLKIDVPNNMFIAHHEEGSWMDRKMMQKWLTNVLRPYARNLPAHKRILILDNHSGHIDPQLKAYAEELGFDFMPLPTNSTKYAQPMDLTVNFAFKKYASENWEDYSSKLTPKDVTKSGYYKPPTREMKMNWISAAWDKIDSKTVSNGFNIYKQAVESLKCEEARTQEENQGEIMEILNQKHSVEEIECEEVLVFKNGASIPIPEVIEEIFQLVKASSLEEDLKVKI